MLITRPMDANKKQRIGNWIIFILYLMILFYFLFFAEMLGRGEISGEYRYNLIPFKEISRFWKYQDTVGFEVMFLNIFGNILAFVPFGFFVSRLSKKGGNLFFGTLMGLELSLLVELCQLIFRIGSFDVDDILLNTLGAFFGYLIHWCLRKMKQKPMSRNKG